MEYWRKIKGYEGYEVSSRGRVRKSERFAWYRFKDGTEHEVYLPAFFVTIHRNKGGERYVHLGENHTRKSITDIQAEAFRGIDL